MFNRRTQDKGSSEKKASLNKQVDEKDDYNDNSLVVNNILQPIGYGPVFSRWCAHTGAVRRTIFPNHQTTYLNTLSMPTGEVPMNEKR